MLPDFVRESIGAIVATEAVYGHDLLSASEGFAQKLILRALA